MMALSRYCTSKWMDCHFDHAIMISICPPPPPLLPRISYYGPCTVTVNSPARSPSIIGELGMGGADGFVLLFFFWVGGSQCAAPLMYLYLYCTRKRTVP